MRAIGVLFSFTNQTQQMARDVCQTQRAMKRTRGQPSLNKPAFCTREAVSLSGTCDNLRRCYNKTMAYLEFTTPLTGSAERPPTNFVTHTITSQPEFRQARNAAPTDTRMTLCASIMSRTCGLWPCGVSGTDVGVSASHNKRVLHLACTGRKRSESRCNPCASSALASTDMFTCHNEASALLCKPNTST